jgi:hypothetical protein
VQATQQSSSTIGNARLIGAPAQQHGHVEQPASNIRQQTANVTTVPIVVYHHRYLCHAIISKGIENISLQTGLDYKLQPTGQVSSRITGEDMQSVLIPRMMLCFKISFST